MNAAVAALAVLLLGAIGIANLGALHRDLERKNPVEAVRALEATGRQNERGFHYFDFGGFLVFHGIPSFVDGRLEPFLDSGIFDRYIEIETRADVDGLEREGVRWVLSKVGTRLSEALAKRPEWERVHRDGLAEVWVR